MMAPSRRALVTGVCGQDGSYLAEHLLSLGYEVHGTTRTCGRRLPPCLVGRVEAHEIDLRDAKAVHDLVVSLAPEQIYNLAGVSTVAASVAHPDETLDINAGAVQAILEAAIACGGRARVFQASSSEMYGRVPGTEPQDERTPFHPASPYAVAKVKAHELIGIYRQKHGLFAVSGILFNHESPRRGEQFVTRKISKGVAEIVWGLREKLTLGALDARRDWGYAPEYTEAMVLALAHDRPGDYVVATGRAHTIREFAEAAFGAAGVSLAWHGDGQEEAGRDRKTGKLLVEQDPGLQRGPESGVVRGNPTRARESFGWSAKTIMAETAAIMVKHDIDELKRTTGATPCSDFHPR